MRRWRGVTCITSCALAWMILPVAQGADEEPVGAIQAFLRQERLYVGPVNGVLDRPTMAGVRRYQILHGLRASGRPDDETLRRMLVPPAPVAEWSDSDRRLLHELAQMPIPDPSAEHRRPLPPLDLPAVAAPPKPQASPQESKRKRTKPAYHRRATTWSSSD